VPIIPPFQVPLLIVPNEVILLCTALGSDALQLGAPSALVIKIELLVVASPPITFADDAYSN
jgi:hypothetical protein